MPNATPAKFDPRTKVAIYGAGNSGIQLRRALIGSSQYNPVAFVDDDPSLWGQNIDTNKVYQPEKIPKLIERDGVVMVVGLVMGVVAIAVTATAATAIVIGANSFI